MLEPKLNVIEARAATIVAQDEQIIYRRTDRLFAVLMVVQWAAGIAAAYWIAPTTWIGSQGRVNPTVWGAIFLGALVSVFPIVLTLWRPGWVMTRHITAVAQLVMSGLLIHFTGGRIETHFHVFGSLAFLAFYRDWPVLITASVVTALDHFFRGYLWPQSIYGVASAQPWRWLEHAGWVVFMDIVLIISVVQSRREMVDMAWRRAETEQAEAALRRAHDRLEQRVLERTAALAEANARNRALLDAAGEGIYGLDRDGLTTFINPAGAEMLLFSADDLHGQSMHAILHHTHADGRPYPKEECPIYACIQDGVVRRVNDEVFWRSDGTRFPAEYVSTPVREDGRIIGAVVVFRDISERLRAEQEIARLHAQLEQRLCKIVALNAELETAYDGTIVGWSRALDLRDHETEGHSLRVTEMTMALAREFGVGEEDLLHIRRGALLHDIGKMGVPDAILNKPGPLTDEERMIMQLHPRYAYEMLVGIPFVHPALDIPYAHHEMWDGTGYPCGLAGTAIPFAARLFAVVDVWDALRSDRPYRSAWTVERTLAHIESLSGSHFDPEVVDVFVRTIVPAMPREERPRAQRLKAA